MAKGAMRGKAWLLVALATSACGSPWIPGDGQRECATALDCTASTDACSVAACVERRCVEQPAAAGTACDDGLFCTVGETCDAEGVCRGGSSPCQELVPGLPKCNEAERACEICTDGRPLVNGECRCPFWDCVARGGAYYCAQNDESEPNSVSCTYDGATAGD
jgi:hypothetical protein